MKSAMQSGYLVPVMQTSGAHPGSADAIEVTRLSALLQPAVGIDRVAVYAVMND